MSFENFDDFLAADARLIILKELARQGDGRLNETLVVATLDRFGHRRSREWVRTQLRKLEDVGAVAVVEIGSVMVATLKRSGLDHVERRTFLEGVAKPSPES